MLWIIILLKPVVIVGKRGVYEGEKGVLKDFFYIKESVHYSTKHQYWGCSFGGNSSPYVDFEWMFRRRLHLCRLDHFSKTQFTMPTEPNAAFIREHDVSNFSFSAAHFLANSSRLTPLASLTI